MAHYTLIARINSGDGKFPFVNVQFSKNHRPIPIEGATDYLRPSSSGKRTPIKIGKDAAVAHTALVRMEDGQPLECTAVKPISSELLTWLVGKVSAFCLRMRGRDRITHAKLSTREQRVRLVEHVAKGFENS
jgi:hypothetical protein